MAALGRCAGFHFFWDLLITLLIKPRSKRRGKYMERVDCMSTGADVRGTGMSLWQELGLKDSKSHLAQGPFRLGPPQGEYGSQEGPVWVRLFQAGWGSLEAE